MDSFLKVWCGIFYSFTQRSFHILLMYVINAATIPNPNPNSPQSKKKKKKKKKIITILKMITTAVFLWFMSPGDEDGELVITWISVGISPPS